ncbi:hypothetical protein MBVG596_0484 [Mycoplasmopsis bovigenitalium]|uniref:lipoprotein 17-related variable surface protein n=1 Tax=Mycoplasmopsis bovigenitalium TaxID=2112 RepID=UPI00090AE25E|nr:lipoprotein 17-related variable surface protein [Mycoplasmopsis bovigenitalium]BAW18236.1 hypothetical protein MBVG596_0484 [Mycoplasmopsis bovigenitalium]
MKKKIGFLLSSCMSLSALPLFAAACKNEQANGGKQEEIDVNTLFKISLPKNSNKKPSELKPEDIVVEILNNDISVEIKKIKFKEGKGVLVSYLATNSKTNKIVDEKTITLEVITKKDQVETKKDKKYDELVTVSVDENTKQKTADKVTREDIKLEVAQGESFKAEVIGVNVQKNNRTVIDVKIKITDNETSKEITKTLEGFAQALPEKILKGYEVFKDIAVVNDDKAYDWLKNAADGTKIYYDFRKHLFINKKQDKNNQNKSEQIAILLTKKVPGFGIETAAHDAVDGDLSFKGTATLVKQGGKIGIKFRISEYNNSTKTTKYYEEIATSNLISIDRITKNDINKIASSAQIDYPGKENVTVEEAKPELINHNIDNNYKFEIKNVEKHSDTNKISVYFSINFMRGDKKIESDIFSKEINGFKPDNFANMFAGIEFGIENATQILPSEVKVEMIKLYNSNKQNFVLPEGVKKEITIKDNSKDDYRGTLSLVFKATQGQNVFENTYNIDGLKTKKLDLDEVIKTFGELTLNEGINKADRYAATIKKEEIKLGQYDSNLVTVNITSLKPLENDSTKLSVEIEFNSRVKSGETKSKSFLIEGFKELAKNKNRDAQLDAYSSQKNIFVFDGSEQDKKILVELATQAKGTTIKIDNSKLIVWSGKRKNTKLDKLIINKSITTKVNTHGKGQNIGYSFSGSALGVLLIKEGNNVVIKYIIDTKTEKNKKVIDKKGQVFTQVLFTIQ